MTAPNPRSLRNGDRYRWVALSNTTAAVFMSALDGSIVIIALPAIFRGIHLDPLAPGNVVYLLWMILGYRLVQAVLVVTVGRLGDMFGRVKIYNAGFAVFTAASVLLSFDPFSGSHGALWLIGWRVLQAFGGSMLTANSAAILTDAFPAEQRGFALGINQVACDRASDRLAAAGLLAVRSRPWGEPGPARARLDRHPGDAARFEPAGPHRAGVLPAPDLATVPAQADGRAGCRHRPVGRRRGRVTPARRPLRPFRDQLACEPHQHQPAEAAARRR
jgi:Major Facilitator Superfamily